MDATTGGAGHSLRIAERLHDTGRLICIDRDDEALENAKDRLKMYGSVSHRSRATSAISTRCSKGQGLCRCGRHPVRPRRFLPQLDHAERGFSYMKDAPLDMRMDRQQKLTAYDVVKRLEPRGDPPHSV